jgi:hypothetical protein
MREMVLIATSRTPGSFATAARASLSILSFKGQAAVVSTSVKLTRSPSTARSSIMWRLTRSRFRSGSMTVPSASRTLSLSGLLMVVGSLSFGGFRPAGRLPAPGPDWNTSLYPRGSGKHSIHRPESGLRRLLPL